MHMNTVYIKLKKFYEIFNWMTISTKAMMKIALLKMNYKHIKYNRETRKLLHFEI